MMRGGTLVAMCRQKSLELLRANATRWGVRASAPSSTARERNYTSIFARDAAICALGMVASRDQALVDTARRGLLTLARYQAPNGQMPNFVKPDTGEVDFYYLGCIDATLWWLVAVRVLQTYATLGHVLRRWRFRRSIRHALAWLRSQEHQVFCLLQQNEASDWADLMPRSGFVLSTNALWYTVKRLYGLPGAAETKQYANLFLSTHRHRNAARTTTLRARRLVPFLRLSRAGEPWYTSFVTFGAAGTEIDIFGNILTGLCGLADQAHAQRIAHALRRADVNRPYPLRTVLRPITPSSLLWRPYLRRHALNLPHQYQNGGIWPFIGAFWVLLLAQLGERRLAERELARVAAANALRRWQFNEWLHGRTGEPHGMPRQSWNAAMFLLADRALQDGRWARVLRA